MITREEEEYVLRRAYVPEHIVGLMVLVSKAEPFLIGDCLCYLKDDWLILIGYPLKGEFSMDRFGVLVDQAIERFKPRSVRMAAPDIPGRYLKPSREIERDMYYRLDLERFNPRARLMREVRKAAECLRVDRTSHFTEHHRAIVKEFIERGNLPSRVEQLYLSMEDYTSQSNTAVLLDARDGKGRLSAFYVVELAATKFAAYIVGCHSKQNYASHASDLLFDEMVRMARESGKSYIELGLRVNDGIGRFKEKWGGRPYLKYTFCDYRAQPTNVARSFASVFDALKKL